MRINLLPPGVEEEGRLRRRYPVQETEVYLTHRPLRLLHPSDIDGLIRRATEEDDLPFWAYLWPAAHGLARRLTEREAAVQTANPTTALELGAGVGLAGMAAALIGWRVTQTDLVPEALRFARVNALRNGLQIPGFVGDWRRFALGARFDVIMGSDILYEPTLHPALERLILRHLKPGGRLLISDPCRVYALHFMARLEDLGARVTVTDAPARPEDDTAVLLYDAHFPDVKVREPLCPKAPETSP